MNLGNLARLKRVYLNDYPLVNLKEKHFVIKEGYKMSAIVFNRPKGNSRKASAQVWLISRFGDIVRENLDFEFRFSESERVEEALKASSFKIRPEALQKNNARKITPEDIVPKWEDVVIEKVKARRTTNSHVWRLILLVHITGESENLEVVFNLDYDDDQHLENVSLTGTIEFSLNAKKNIDKIKFENPKKDDDLKINPAIASGSPPSMPTKDIIIPAEHIKIIKLDYIPPKGVDDHEAALKVEYLNRETDRVVSAWKKIYFTQTIRESAIKLIKSIPQSDFHYLVLERKTIPLEISAKDFHYFGNIPGLKIVDVKYNYNAIDMHRRFIDVVIIIEYKTMFFEINKILEFAWSKQEYIDGSFRTVKHENDSIILAKFSLQASFLKKVVQKNKVEKNKLIESARISNNYPYHKILDIDIVRYADDSNLVIFAIKALEKIDKSNVIHSFEKHEIIPKTYHEEMLEKLKPQDIEINYEILPLAPVIDLSEQLFIIPKWCTFHSMQYSKPDPDKKTMQVQLKLSTGEAVVFIEKVIKFKMTLNEFYAYEQEIWELDYLKNIDPSDIEIDLDLSGEPVESISPYQIQGIPEGIEISVDYRKPGVGKRTTRIYVHLRKNNSQITFEQTLVFAYPTRGRERYV